MTFAFSRGELEKLIENSFRGEWKYLNKALFEVSEQRAAKALIEIASFIRLLDDQDDISGYLKQTGGHSFGLVIKEGKDDEVLYLRDLTNKIMHAARYEWNFSDPDNPSFICYSSKPERWGKAKVELVKVASFCGQLMS